MWALKSVPEYLIVGLGNPGTKYRETRHNTGFMVIDLISRMSGTHFSHRRFGSKSVLTKFEDINVLLCCPMSFMNLSGKPVMSYVKHFDLEMDQILVVHDDLDLPLGKLKVVRGGGAGGHRGVLSIIEHLGTKDFARLKVGIGRPSNGNSVEEYVLAPFNDEEQKIMKKILPVAVKGCELFVLEGVDSAMNHVNSQNMTIISREEKV